MSESGISVPTETESQARKRLGKTFPNDYWIVTHHDFKEHPDTESAYAERCRLQTLNPGKVFAVRHCKRRIAKNEQSRDVIARQAAEIEQLSAALTVMFGAWDAITTKDALQLIGLGHDIHFPCMPGPINSTEAAREVYESIRPRLQKPKAED